MYGDTPPSPCHPMGDMACSYSIKQSVVALCDRDTEKCEQSSRGSTSVEQETGIKGSGTTQSPRQAIFS